MATVTAEYKVTISYASTLDSHQPRNGSLTPLYHELWLKLLEKAASDPWYFGQAIGTVNYTYDSNQQPEAVTFTVESGFFAKRILDIARQVTY